MLQRSFYGDGLSTLLHITGGLLRLGPFNSENKLKAVTISILIAILFRMGPDYICGLEVSEKRIEPL